MEGFSSNKGGSPIGSQFEFKCDLNQRLSTWENIFILVRPPAWFSSLCFIKPLPASASLRCPLNSFTLLFPTLLPSPWTQLSRNKTIKDTTVLQHGGRHGAERGGWHHGENLFKPRPSQSTFRGFIWSEWEMWLCTGGHWIPVSWPR